MPVYFSQNYTTASNIAASGHSGEQFIEESDQWASGPFDTITIQNSDSVALKVNLDGNPDNGIVVLPNSREGGFGLKFRNFTITNLDTSTAHTAGKIYIKVENTKFPRRD